MVFLGKYPIGYISGCYPSEERDKPPPEKTESQLSAERQALESNKNNFPGGPGGN